MDDGSHVGVFDVFRFGKVEPKKPPSVFGLKMHFNEGAHSFDGVEESVVAGKHLQ